MAFGAAALTIEQMTEASTFATFLAALAAMVTAVGTLLTVRQMQRQMEASYRPELTFPRTWVRAEVESPQCPLPIRWVPPQDPSSAVTVVSPPQKSYLQLYNVGLGAATNVRGEWNLPVVEMIQEINAMAQRALTPVYYKYERDSVSLHSDIWPIIHLNWSIGSVSRNFVIDYILPEKQPTYFYFGGGATLEIPLPFIYLVSSCLYFRVMQKDATSSLETPPLNMKISYHDISGRKHEGEFNLRLHVMGLTPPQENTSMAFDGYIEAEKVALNKARPMSRGERQMRRAAAAAYRARHAVDSSLT
jgi:hypothetical protein